MIHLKTPEEIEYIRKSSLLVSQTHALLVEYIKPGVKTSKLDEIAEEFINDNGGKPSFKGYGGFPATLCISINEQVVHGFPSEREIKEGDILSIDCGVFKDGFHGDSAAGPPAERVSWVDREAPSRRLPRTLFCSSACRCCVGGEGRGEEILTQRRKGDART